MTRIVVVFVVIALLVGGGWYLDTSRSREQAKLTGVFESQPTVVSSRVRGRVVHIDAVEGKTVTTGQVLIDLEAAPDASDVRAKKRNADEAREQLREALDGPRPEEVRHQRAVVAEAQANLARLQDGALPEEIAQARARFEGSEAVYQKALRGPRPQEVGQARAEAEAAHQAYLEQLHGATAEERGEAQARLDSATAQETRALADLTRYRTLLTEEAVTHQQFESVLAAEKTARADQQQAELVLKRLNEGTRPEVIAQAKQAFKQSEDRLDLLLAGTRPEDIRAAAADAEQAHAALVLVAHGPRIEDIQAAKARLRQAQADLELLLAGTRPERVAQLRASANSASATWASARDVLGERTVRAPRAGNVDRVLVAVGDLVSAEAPLVRMSDPTDIWVRVYVPESALSQVYVGETAQMQVDGIPDRLLGTVDSIAAQGEFTPANLQTPDERGKQVFGIRLRLTHPDTRVRAGMAVTVTRIGRWTP